MVELEWKLGLPFLTWFAHLCESLRYVEPLQNSPFFIVAIDVAMSDVC